MYRLAYMQDIDHAHCPNCVTLGMADRIMAPGDFNLTGNGTKPNYMLDYARSFHWSGICTDAYAIAKQWVHEGHTVIL